MNVDKTNKLAIVVASYDGYSDLWKSFFEMLFKFWPELEFNIYLINNEKEYNFYTDKITVLNTGPENSWSEKIHRGLNRIDEEVILLFLEDYFIGDYINTDSFMEAYSFFLDNDIDYLRVVNTPANKGNQRFNKLKENIRYGVNLQLSFWDKDSLKLILKSSNFSAWEFEKMYNDRELPIDLQKCYTMKNDLFKIKNGVIKGKWYPDTISYFANIGIDIKKDSKRDVMTNLERRKYKNKVFLKRITPNFIIRIIKPILKKLGFKFTT